MTEQQKDEMIDFLLNKLYCIDIHHSITVSRQGRPVEDSHTLSLTRAAIAHYKEVSGDND